jgi:maleylpyruvate isomerase
MGTVRSMDGVDDVVQGLAKATADLVADVDGLTDAEARGPSLLPGWTRGHVLTHLARNAEGGTRLLTWARTGIPSYEYRSVAARAAAIEDGAGRPATVLAADVRATASAMADAAAQMPRDAWQNQVTWTTGQDDPAEMVVRSRLGEVFIHHVDLDIGYAPRSWPTVFVTAMLDRAVRSVNDRLLAALTVRLDADDTGRSFRIGRAGADLERISGTEADLLAWLLGRSDGAGLGRDRSGALPAVQSIYFT